MNEANSNDSRPLSGQVAVVTGAGRGIGAATAALLAGMGATVVLCGRTRELLENVTSAIVNANGRADVMACDVTDSQSVESVASQVDQKYSRLDILVNNAAVRGVQGPLHEMPPESWDDVMNTNLRGVFYCVRAFVPLMVRGKYGHIINISSLAGRNALPNGAAYSASKWGLNGLTNTLAEELRGYNIRVSAVAPGSVNTEFSTHAGKDSGKMLQPDDIAHAVGMLVTQSPQSFVSEILIRPTQKP
jgi:3-oxoacyl-[acyl-carrier protein] reductase